MQYSALPIEKISPPKQSLATINGKFSKVNLLTDSQPKSSKAITSQDVIQCDANAPAPPMAHRYIALFLTIASLTA